MDHLTCSLADLLVSFRFCFRQEAFLSFAAAVEAWVVFAAAVEAWVVCLGPRTLSEVWQFSVLAPARHYSTIHDLFSRARWDWDELGQALLALLVVQFAPAGTVWLAVDDTL